MKKLRRRIYASADRIPADLDMKYSLSPSQICRFLSQVTQLQGQYISAKEAATGTLDFIVGNDVYVICDAQPRTDTEEETETEVPYI